MKAKERLALEALTAMRNGRKVEAFVFLQSMLLLRQEQRRIVELLESKRCEGVVLAAVLPHVPLIFKDAIPRPASGWREMLREVVGELRGVHGIRGEVLEKLFRLSKRASWPEVRFLRQLVKRVGKEVTVDDLVFAVEWLHDHRDFLDRMGVGTFSGVNLREVERAEAPAQS